MSSKLRYALVLVPTVVLILGLAGCQGGPAPAAAPTTQAAAQPVPMTALDGVVVHGGDLYPLRNFTGTYDITKGGLTRHNVPYRLEPEGADGWRLTVGDVRVLHFQQEPDGSIVLAQEDELADDAAIIYTPAVPMLPLTLAPNQPQETDGQVVVRSLKTGQVRDRGDCHTTIELLGRQEVQTPSGAFDAYMVRTVRQLNLNLASVRLTILSGYSPDNPLVLQQVTQVRRLLGLVSSREEEESRLSQ